MRSGEESGGLLRPHRGVGASRHEHDRGGRGRRDVRVLSQSARCGSSCWSSTPAGLIRPRVQGTTLDQGLDQGRCKPHIDDAYERTNNG